MNSKIERKNIYIKDLEHIRDCYYKEIAERIENNKIFKSNKQNKKLTKYQKWEIEKEIEKNFPENKESEE